jgi:hypothetical protein
MIYTVEVRHIGSDTLAELMAAMRTWLDHHRIQPKLFNTSTGCPGVTFRVGFSAVDEAGEFAQAFRGRLGSADPQGAVLWEIPDPI